MMIHTGIKLQKAKPRDLQGYLTGFFFLHSNWFWIYIGEKPFECEICKRRFREQSDLRKHKKVHNNNNSSARCAVCNRNQPSSRHTTKCISCEKQEAARRYRDAIADEPVPRIDANNKKAFLCKYCDRAFGSSSNLKRHVMIHTGEKVFTC